MSDALRPLVGSWVSKMKLAWDNKKRLFQDDADEAMRFFDGPYDWLYGWRGAASSSSTASFQGADDYTVPAPTFRMTLNKVAELVQLFGPSLYHKNPVRKVNPRQPPLLPASAFGDPNDPMVQQAYQMMMQQVMLQRNKDGARAALIEHYLNYTPTALDLKTESRWAIDEALIKGRGCLWTEKYNPTGAPITMVGSFYDSVDHLLIDPDAERMCEAQWVARRCVGPHWKVEMDYGLPPGSLRGSASVESFGQQANVASNIDGDYMRRQGFTNDLVVYWHVYSKMGAGDLLSGASEASRQALQPLGQFVYLVVCPNCPYPLNLPPPLCDALGSEDPGVAQQAAAAAQQAVRWETPFWADDTWPVTFIDFHPVPRRVWPVSHIKPAFGELKFLNWAFSFLAGKVRTSCRDFLAIAKSAGEELKERIRTGPDYTVLEVESIHGSIDQVVKFLQHPGFNPEIYRVIESVAANFDRRTGLTELMYGVTSKQIRSAEEANAKQEQLAIRPDDMGNKVEDAMSEIARKEAFAARWHVTAKDVLPVMGQVASQWWTALVEQSDPTDILHQLEHRIEAGSTKKPNQAAEQQNMQAAMQNLLQPLFSVYTGTGNPGPFNNLISEWAKSMNFDPSGFLLPAMPPPAPPAPPGPPMPPRG